MSKSTNLEVQTINHLGLIAGIIDEIGIVEIINKELGIKPQEKLNSGQIVKAIIINAMGFVSRPIYLFTQFFEDKATEHLFGKGILAEHFNDDKIGRVMDKIYQKGLSNIFLLIAISAFKKYGIDKEYLHLDATSISVQGDYKICENMDKIEELEPKPIKIVHGYSRDKRPDLKQFLINLIVSGDGDVPLFFEGGDGNKNDKAEFGKLLANFKKQIDFETIMVADSALSSQGNLFLIKDLKWITRVPLSIKAAQLYVREIPNSELVKTEIEGYKVVEKKSNYGGVEQKWLVVESEARKKSDLKKLEKKVTKDSAKAQEILTSLVREKFTSVIEAKTIIKSEQKKLKYHNLQLIKLVKTQDNQTQKTIYKAQVSFAKNLEQIEAQCQRAGRFI